MQNRKLVVGYVGLSKASWMTPKIENISKQAIESLSRLDIEVVPMNELATTEEEAIEAASEFRRKGVDAVIVHFTTFPAGAMIPALIGRIEVPVILFANPEEPTADGMWEQNSFCGANLGAFVMRKLGKPMRFAWGKAEEADKALAPALSVVRAETQLREARIGIIGGRVPGFYTSNMDEMKLRKQFGATVETIDLVEILELARKIGGEEAQKGLQIVHESAKTTCGVSSEELRLGGNLLAAIQKTVEKYKLTALGIRCWPEFSDIYGIAPCSTIGMLNSLGMPTSCEGDLPGVVTMLIQKGLLENSSPFFMDFISFDEKDNTGVVWHCGATSSKLCGNFEETKLCKHFRVDGGNKKGLTNEFSLKPGRITVTKLDETENGYRMLIFTGTGVEMNKFMRGNPLRIKFDTPVRGIVDTIMKKGFEHHYAVVYGDIKDKLISFCETNGIEPVVC